MNSRTEVIEDLITKIKARQTGELNDWNEAYFTTGGTYIIASNGIWNDNDKPHDLVAILPPTAKAFGMNSNVVPLSPTVNTDFIDALREAFDE